MSLKGENPAHSFDLLSELVARLRRECPWDREQTLDSLKPHLLEEACETALAVESGDSDALKEELGDLLLLILLYCEISSEFTIEDVAASTVDKMKSRHPHVFGKEKLGSSREVVERWEEIKRKDRKQRGKSALDRASALNDRAMKAGFNPEALEDVMAKLHEELEELKRAGTQEAKHEESGDMLFTAVNICRMLRVEPESALLESCAKFEHRLRRVFKELKNRGKAPEDASFQEMDEIWNAIK